MSETINTSHSHASSRDSDDAFTTVNGGEIRRPTEALKFEDFGSKIAELGLSGSSPKERAEQLRHMGVEEIAGLLDELNMGLQGSDETLLSSGTMKVGDTTMIPVEYRYDVFETVANIIKQAPADTNPARIGDALGLAVVMLHPFQDGNGRTARAIGYVFQPDFDTSDQVEDIAFYAQSREALRDNGGGFAPLGYIPRMPEGRDQSNPSDVIEYFHALLGNIGDAEYTGTFGSSTKKI